MQPQIIPLTDASQFKPAGLPWKTVDQARWAFRTRHENGLAGCFVRLNRNIAINVPKFHELVAKRVA